MKSAVFCLVLLLYAGHIWAQGSEFGVYSEAELSMEKVPFDPEASIVVLFESGISQPLYTETGYSSIVHGIYTKYHYRYKILKDNVQNFGDIRIPFYPAGELKIEQVAIVSAQVSYLEEGERVVKELSKDDIKLVELDNGFSEYRIIFPNVKKGSILEWKYEKLDRAYYSLEGWAFQGEYPKLKSYFSLKSPLFLQYQLVIQGKRVREALIQSKKRDFFEWEIDSISSFRAEPYIINPLDYLDRVEGFLSRDGSQGDQIVYSTWAELGYQIQSIKSFESYFKGNSLRKIGMNEGFTGSTPLEIAKNAYRFVANEFELGPSVYALPTQTANDLLKSKKGNHLDINLLLLVIFQEYGIKSNLVLINQKGENRTNLIPSPFLDQFSASLIRAEIDGKMIWLDATDKTLPFGLISPKKLMPQGFLIDGKSSSLIPINLSHDSGLEINISVGRDSVDQFEYRNQAKISGLSLMSIKESQNQEPETAEENDTYDVEVEDHFLSERYVSSSFKRHAANVDEQILIFNPFDQSIFYQNLFLDEERRFTIEFE
jgi:hypothetical protein